MGEFGSLPAVGVEMTQLALSGKSCRDMIRLSGFCVIFLMAAKAVYPVHHKTRFAMALDAVESSVDSFQRITGHCEMIPFVRRNILPGESRVAITAVRSKPELVAVILAAFPVANLACCRSSLKDFVLVALSARDGAVSPRERKVGLIVFLHGPALDVLLLSHT